MTISNKTPFGKAISSFLNHAVQTETKYLDVLVAMFEMKTTFTKEWTERFLKTSGKEKTGIIETTFRGLELEGYEALLTAAKAEVKTTASKEEHDTKEDAQRKTNALKTMLKTVAFALAGLHLSNVTKCEVKKGGRVRFLIGGGWDGGLKGYSFSTIVSLGKDRAKEAGWVEDEPKGQVNRTSGQKESHGPASPGQSAVETAETVVASEGANQPQQPNGNTAFTQICQALRTMLKVKDHGRLSESEQKELRHTERALIKYVFGDTKGKVDLEALMFAYEEDAQKPAKQENAA
jgi:hypothetical protein